MNLHTQPNIAYAIQQHWISPAPPAPAKSSNYLKYDMPYRQRLYAAGLTSRGTVRKRRATIAPAIIAAAKRDGVSVTAIYNRIKRTGTMRPSNHPNSKGVCHV